MKKNNQNRDISHYPPRYIADGSGRKSTTMLVYYENMKGKETVASGNGITFSSFFFIPISQPTRPFPALPLRHRRTLGRDVWRTAAPGGKRQNCFGALNPAHLYCDILYIYIQPKAQLYTPLLCPTRFHPPIHPSTHPPSTPRSFRRHPRHPAQKRPHYFNRANGLYIPFYINWTPAHFHAHSSFAVDCDVTTRIVLRTRPRAVLEFRYV